MDSIDFAEIARWLATIGLQIVIIIGIAIIAYVILSVVSRIVAKRVKQFDDVDGSDLDKRTETIRRMVKASGTVVIIAIAFLMILDRLGIDIRPILASVGVVSLALGLGAQTLVKDVIGGIFIIFEGQFHIGDVIEFNGIVGTVEDITLRATRMRDSDGTLHIIPNGELRIVSNRTRGWSRATVDVTIPYNQDIETVYQALDEVNERASREESIATFLVDDIVITGVEGLDDWGVRVRITGKTLPNKQWDVQRYLRKQLLDVLASKNITVAKPLQGLSLTKTT
ncbi:MAG TPA: mechanosensitive ion channel family protein [candidate division Zixibacteria bacterium]|nr:mechanosensitive ion channel family protein [candidate division Zixibacteria bacterium]